MEKQVLALLRPPRVIDLHLRRHHRHHLWSLVLRRHHRHHLWSLV